MWRLLAGGLGCLLACLATATAADMVLAPAADPSATPAADDQALLAGISLGSPEPVTESAEAPPLPVIADSSVEPASFQSLLPRVIRAQKPDSATSGDAEPASSEFHLVPLPTDAGSDFASGASPAAQVGGIFAAERAAPAVIRTAFQATTPTPTRITAVASPVSSTDDCNPPKCDCCDACCVRNHRFYGSAEYLLWWVTEPRFPILVTTGTLASQGILGNPGTAVLFGGETEHLDPSSGGRFTIGWWCDPCQHWGIEGSYFFLGDRSVKFRAGSNGSTLLTRPFFNINDGREDSEITAAPGIAAGNIAVDDPLRLWGAELNLRCNICSGCTWRIDWLTGFRYVELDENLRISENVFVLPGSPLGTPGDFATVQDEFSTRNQFYGGQVGLDAEWRHNRWVVDFRGKVALGDNHETVIIKGSQLVTHANGSVQGFNGGLLALPSNIGRV
jgi:hypothetical protein